MKRSKIFLGATTALLAVAGVAAAKHYGPSATRYYITFGGKLCKAFPSTCLKEAIATIGCVATYTKGDPSHTVLHGLLYTNGPENPKTASNCTSVLRYLQQ